MQEKTICGFGIAPTIKSEVHRVEDLAALQHTVKKSEKILATGNFRSYGDSALNEKTIDMRKLDHILAFDKESGIIKCEAGIILGDLLEVIVPQGWFVHVTPGTKYVTLGGCIASNVHGKNHHHYGSFSESVISLDIVLADGDLVKVSEKNYRDLFEATQGGMGLTGVIYAVEFKLKPIKSAFIDIEHVKCSNLDMVFDELEKAEQAYDYTVTWIDSHAKGKKMGRGIIMAGNHSIKGELKVHSKLKIPVPFMMPSILLNKLTLKLFNLFYYTFNRSKHAHVHYDTFFYPLDMIDNWNRMYGKRGFTQYQFVVPLDKGREAVRKILKLTTKKKCGSFLAVLKTFKKEDNYLSFPMEGYTLAMDFPLHNRTKSLLPKLDKIVKEYGGRLYLTKDLMMGKEMMEGYMTKEWQRIRNKYDPKHKFVSQQSKRLGL